MTQILVRLFLAGLLAQACGCAEIEPATGPGTPYPCGVGGTVCGTTPTACCPSGYACGKDMGDPCEFVGGNVYERKGDAGR